jgi:S1-C subfamily serine protease
MYPYNTAKLVFVALLSLSALSAAQEPQDFSESIKQSLVFLDISNCTYEQIQPWKQTDITKEEGFGVAVGPNRVLTTAENVMYATYIQARVYSNNSYIPANVLAVDYECNLCLLELDAQALNKPLSPVTFAEKYPKGEPLTTYWLSAGNDLTTARSSLDRAEVQKSDVSFVRNLSFIVSNTSRPFGDGEVCTWNGHIIGLAAWGNGSDAGIIPTETINRFLSHADKDTYVGFGAMGFETYNLLDPSMRRYLKLPDDTQHGVYVSTVYTLGTGSSELKHGDVILSIDGQKINPYGRYKHPVYDLISFHHLILQQSEGSSIPVEIVREGKPLTLSVTAKSIRPDQMLVPYYQYGNQPQYCVTGGYVFQQLTRDYLTMWGDGWPGKVPPHLFNYFFSESFKPSDKRSEIVVLSYVLPSEINLGYQQLARLVVDKVNGKKISSLKDFVSSLEADNEQHFHTITFEMEAPILVIPKAGLPLVDQQIAQMYGITKSKNIR